MGKRRNSDNVGFVVKNKICIECGACVSVCPTDALWQEYDNVRGITTKFDGAECTECGLCVKVCPSIDFYGRLGKSKSQYEASYDKSIGPFINVHVAYSSDARRRKAASSGGMVMETLHFLFENNSIAGAVITVPDRDPQRPRAIIATTIEDLKKTKGSRYSLCNPNQLMNRIVREIKITGNRFVFVGVGCEIRAATRLLSTEKSVRDKLFLIGLMCQHNPYLAATKSMLQHLGHSPDASIDYRGQGWPGYIRTRGSNGAEIRLLGFPEAWDLYMCEPFFIPIRCLICPDPTAELADVSLGDAWLPKLIRSDREGTSLVVTRTQAGEEIFSQLKNANRICSKPVHFSIVDLSQSSMKKKAFAFYAARILTAFVKDHKLISYTMRDLEALGNLCPSTRLFTRLQITLQTCYYVIAALLFAKSPTLIYLITSKIPEPIYRLIRLFANKLVYHLL